MSWWPAIGLLALGLPAFGCGVTGGSRQDPSIGADAGPDIQVPGPDFGFIPNSAQIVPPGRVFVETALESTTSGGPSGRTTYIPVLVRAGVVGDLELRAQMSVVNHEERPTGDVTGRGPLDLGFKYRFTKGGSGLMEPSVGLEAQFVLPVASADMDSGKIEPALFCNLDHFLAEGTVFTWNAGAFAPVDSTGEQYLQAYLAGAINQNLSDDFQVYLTGEWRAPTAHSGDGTMGRVGTGLYWYFNRRMVLVAGYNWGLTDAALDGDGLLGVTFAF